MMLNLHLIICFSLIPFLVVLVDCIEEEDDEERLLQQRIKNSKLDLWSRGAYQLDNNFFGGDELEPSKIADTLEDAVTIAPLRLGPVRQTRRDILQQRMPNDDGDRFNGRSVWELLRGGAAEITSEEAKVAELSKTLGPEFVNAIEQNKLEHAQDCQESCKKFYCANPETSSRTQLNVLLNGTTVTSYSFGGVPPEDFAEEFGFPLDLIKVTSEKPLFSKEEAAEVIDQAEKEGVSENGTL